ncbi:protein kinase [Streptomyces cinnabarinus]|uniref:non-specific serine/threonine protein kinase n=1 Tax=Streptomyces cinnabarinus TaxID=67287 RepID=A0ABY7KF96_9ACTN|nr:serine/threonine-protein kinase [Streptomyces cinnabarinus]WAZ23004.1 protein kinase [Streptomyces cinnabarinus]
MDAAGDVVGGRFELIERLGSGGMGTVWRAWDTVLQREVALKAVRPEAEASDTVRERVLREARALARLSNPHVVAIHQIVEADPHPWIVMELVPGVSLQQRLDGGTLQPAEAARIGRQVLTALRVAHDAGIRHRDVKPANILLRPDGTAVLTDFGIAALQGTTSLTVTGQLVGSPEYMAPERIRGHGDTPASDLWALGLVLYVCTEGVSPLRRAHTLATLAAVLDDPVPPPVRSGPLSPVLQALLVRDPSARPDAARLDAMLAAVESGATPGWAAPTAPTVTAAPMPPLPQGVPGPPDPPTRPDAARGQGPGAIRRRTTVLVAAAATLVVLATATAVVLALRASNETGTTDDARVGTSTSASATQPASPTPSPSASAPTEPTRSPSASPTAVTPSRTVRPKPPAAGGQWIAQLYSEPVSSGTAARDERLARIRTTVPGAVYVRSDNFASLRPGYWVIYAPGPFADGRAALRFCAERGRTTATTCIGRYLSKNAADFSLQCRPPATSPTGRCTRPGQQ